MKARDLFQTSSRGLVSNKGRSMLTILGIVIGVASIIMIVSVGDGARELILGQFQGIGTRAMFIEPGREPQGPSAFFEVFTDSLKERDVDAIVARGNVPGVVDAAPINVGTFPITWREESKRVTVFGTTRIFAEVMELSSKEGDFFNDDDVRARAPVAVLGEELRNDLFGDSDAIGQVVKIKNVSFRIVGVMPKKGNIGVLNIDGTAIVPYTTAQNYLTGTDYFQNITVRVESEDIMPRVEADIKALLRANHGISDPDKDDFHITTPADAVERVSMVTGIMTAFLTAVAAISLIVGGIGIMNIMLVSVTERTKEIGLRKAVGATNSDIMNQFMLEAVLLTATGGLIGIAVGTSLGIVGAIGLSTALDVSWGFVFPVQAMVAGVVVSSVVGLVFGLYPARKAARLDPVEALRYE